MSHVYTNTYVEVIVLNLSCPAVSQICNLTFSPSTSTVLILKSTPIVVMYVPVVKKGLSFMPKGLALLFSPCSMSDIAVRSARGLFVLLSHGLPSEHGVYTSYDLETVSVSMICPKNKEKQKQGGVAVWVKNGEHFCFYSCFLFLFPSLLRYEL